MKDINPLAIFKVRGERLDIDDRLTFFSFGIRHVGNLREIDLLFHVGKSSHTHTHTHTHLLARHPFSSLIKSNQVARSPDSRLHLLRDGPAQDNRGVGSVPGAETRRIELLLDHRPYRAGSVVRPTHRHRRIIVHERRGEREEEEIRFLF